MIPVTFELNGRPVALEVSPDRTLLDVLRDQLALTGSKEGCAEGECGACTVLLDERPVTACLVIAPQVDGRTVTTIEGLADRWARRSGRGTNGVLHPVQEAFIETGAVQCGFCIPGMILSAVALLEKNREPDEMTIRRALGGNFCRCTGYNKIFDAVRLAAGRMGGERVS